MFNLTMEHIILVGMAILIAIVIGVSIGIYLTVNDTLAETVLAAASILLTIPSLALFGIMIPFFSIIGHGIGFVPALTALVLYSLLPIIRNTYTGIKHVDPNVIDAANGLGMKKMQRLIQVEIPNGLPVMMAGIRTAVVMNIGIGVIAAFIGAGGLGSLIVQGISRGDMYSIVAGAVLVSLLAIIADTILLLLQKWFTPKGTIH
ncbi:ABC transporter permease [Shouchella lehensis]|uniref:ABC transporter permease n=1 Tax=Shouchella lehensis TaxID=300825 RepID=A0A4Y7WT09_9BACI|nr:ABC transporter permease [Shouchella lehensis]MBG9784632.1 choline ABC transporter permease [Shouchella lehensis]RQW21438.1 ABC transporter permease [Bacillus sp. C1-1]TES51537.1 ABC transporter permease [Shouchella lehensis]